MLIAGQTWEGFWEYPSVQVSCQGTVCVYETLDYYLKATENLGIKWQDRVPNTNVLQRADMPSIPTLLIQRRLRWLGHVHRMEPDCLPRQVLYGELWEGADEWADHSFALRMFASMTCVSLISIQIPGRSLRKTKMPGITVWRRGYSGPRRQSSGRRERNDKYQFERPLTTSVPAATKTATQGSGFWVTQEPVDASPRRGCQWWLIIWEIQLHCLYYTSNHIGQ